MNGERKMEATPKLRYRDLTVEMTDLREDTFSVRVIGETPDGREMRADEVERPRFESDLNQLIGKLARRRTTQQELILLGQKLGELLLPGKVRELYLSSLAEIRRNREGLRLRLRIEPPQLAALPWELAHLQQTGGEPVAGDFLCLQRDVSVTRYENIGLAVQPVAPKDKFKIAIALANPMADLNVDADRRAIEAAINAFNTNAGEMGLESIVLESATRQSLQTGLKGVDIFHFAGHGKFDAQPGDTELRNRGQIILEKEDGSEDPLDSDRLAQIITHNDVRLVVLGACRTAARDAQAAWSGVAPALVRANVPAVLAMQFNVEDDAVTQFISAVYSGIFAGDTIDQAVTKGRWRIFAGVGQQNFDWARMRDWMVPVLYLRAPDGLLFPIPEEAGPTADGRYSALVRIRQKVSSVEGRLVGAGKAVVNRGTTLEIGQEAGSIGPNGEMLGVGSLTLGSYPSGRKPAKDDKRGGKS
jgi:CHAT domain